jgi:hypothetical protein
LTVCCGAAAKRLTVHEVPTLLPAWVPDGFAAFNPYGMGRHQARTQAADIDQRRLIDSDTQPTQMIRLFKDCKSLNECACRPAAAAD